MYIEYTLINEANVIVLRMSKFEVGVIKCPNMFYSLFSLECWTVIIMHFETSKKSMICINATTRPDDQ